MKPFKETSFCKFWVDGGMLFVIYKSISYLDLSTAKKIVSNRLLFQESEPYYIYCDTRGITDSSKKARDYLAREGSVLARAIAIFDNRDLGSFMLRYYLLRNQPVVPTALFSSREEAISFLRDQMKIQK